MCGVGAASAVSPRAAPAGRLLFGDRRVVFRNLRVALDRRDPLLNLGNLFIVVQQGIGQIKLRAGARLQLLHAFLLALNGHRIGIAGAWLDAGNIALFLAIGVFHSVRTGSWRVSN